MLRLLYTAIVILLIPFAILRYYLKSISEPLYRYRMRERLGWLPELRDSLWIHCVSHGETQAARTLILSLATQHPDRPLLLSTTTATGRALAEQIAQSARHQNIHVTYLPFDVPCLINRALRLTQPRLLVIMETELWPNLLLKTAAADIPIALINGRLSARSAQRYAKAPRTMCSILDTFSLIAVRDRLDKQRFEQIGAKPEHIRVMGNIKFDQPIDDSQRALGQLWRHIIGTERPIWAALSTHEGEEAFALAAHDIIRRSLPTALLIIVPRHPNRFGDVAKLLANTNDHFARRDQLPNATSATSEEATQPPAPSSDHSHHSVLLGDSMGEMMAYCCAADIALVGGSLAPIGGHNVLEPMSANIPVITGPYSFNFQHIIEGALDAKAIIQLSAQQCSADALAHAVLHLFTDQEYSEQLTSNANAFIQAHQGANDRVEQAIHALLD